jgi:hypothetical protein
VIRGRTLIGRLVYVQPSRHIFPPKRAVEIQRLRAAVHGNLTSLVVRWIAGLPQSEEMNSREKQFGNSRLAKVV